MTGPFDVDREEQHRKSILRGRLYSPGTVVQVAVSRSPWSYAYEEGPVVEVTKAGVLVVDLPSGRVSTLPGLVRLPLRPAPASRAGGEDLMPGTNALSPFGRPRTRAEVERRRAGS